MARAGFGGSGDYSGFFSSLYSANRDNQRAQQDADDQDAFDKWQNGLMSDDEWLQYIRGRIDAYTGDPKRVQKWVDNLRKYSVVISDNQAEFAYKNGGSINQLISYYQGRLGTLDKNSTEARDLQLRVNDLLDQRASDSITDGAQALVDGINKGKKTYGDLQKFLQAKLKETRPNSDLRSSLEKQLKQVNEQIRTNAVEGSFEKLQYQYDAGKLSAGSYAKQLRSMATQFKDSDPKRYYQILEAAVALDKRGGSGGGGGGGTSAAKRASTKALNQTIDSIQAQRNVAQSLVKQFEDKGGRFGSVGVDPQTGKPVTFTPDMIHKLDLSLLGTFDKLASAYKAKGDLSAAANAQKAKASFISTNIVRHNTMAADDQSRELMLATNKVLDHVKDDPDPTHAMNELRGIAQNWSDFSKGLDYHKTTTSSFAGNVRARLPAEEGGTAFTTQKGPLEQVDTDFSARSQAFAGALQTLTRPGVTDEEAMSALEQLGVLEGGGSGQYGGAQQTGTLTTIAKGFLEIHAREQGLQPGPNGEAPQLARIFDGDGKLKYVRTVTVNQQTLDPNGNLINVQKTVPALDGIDGKSTKLVDIFVDVNGTPTKVQAVAREIGVDGFDAWTTAKAVKLPDGTTIPAGRALTQAQIKALGDAGFKNQVNAGAIAQKPALNAWQVNVPGYTDAQGTYHPGASWVQDKGTGLWYQGALPVRAAQRDANGMVKFDENGAMIDWKAYGSAAGVPAPYVGNDPKAMQAMSDALGLGKDTRTRDATGRVTDTPYNPALSYWDPIDAGLRDASRRDSWWDDDARQSRADQQLAKDRATVQAAKSRQDSFMRANLSDDEYKQYQRGEASKIAGALGSALAQSPLGQLAKSFGINLDGTASQKQDVFANVAKQQAATSAEARAKAAMAGMNASLGAGKKSVAPMVALPKAGNATPQTFTGPTVKHEVALELPAAQAKSIPKIPQEDLAPSKPTPTKQAPKVTPKAAPAEKVVYSTPLGSRGIGRV